jgi:hypothetical protein
MPSTLTIPAVLPRTLDDVRRRLMAELGTVGIPNLHWPLSTGEDCLGFLTWASGIRQRDDLTTALISIRAFRASAGWHEVGPREVRPGDWALWDWDGDGEPDHATFGYSVDRLHNEITTVEANTSPRPGVPLTTANRGVYRKTRPLSSPELWGALRPAYLTLPTTTADQRAVRDEATGRTITLHRTDAGDHGSVKGDGKRGPLYRLLVQAWGRQHGLYGKTYRLDGIFGPRSEVVEDHLAPIARAAR